MNTLAFEPRAKKVTFDIDNMWVELTDGRQLGVPLAYFPRLLNAIPVNEFFMLLPEVLFVYLPRNFYIQICHSYVYA